MHGSPCFGRLRMFADSYHPMPGSSRSMRHVTTERSPRLPPTVNSEKVQSSEQKESDQRSTTKRFVLDTNVLLHNPDCLTMFTRHEVVIPLAVLEELDHLKRDHADVGRNAREAIRQLDAMRRHGRLTEGVKRNEQGGIIRVALDPKERSEHLRSDSVDDRIINVAWHLAEQGHSTVFVSKDLNARIRADAIGLVAEDFESEKVDADRLYSGYRTIDVTGSAIDELYTERQLSIDTLEEHLIPVEAEQAPEVDLHANEFALLRDAQDSSHTGLARRLGDTNHVIPVSGPRRPVFGIMARNMQQTMALDLLLDDDIQLVTLLGRAGTGKTLLALAAGMTKVFNEERYDRLLVARPIMPLGRDIGYLPGDKDEKLSVWMQPIFDNLIFLLSNRGSRFESAESHSSEQRVEKLIAERKLVMEPLTYIRGRSIPHQFMVIDEAQNLTPHEVKTITSRVGEGTKIVLTGDIRQIDNPYLDDESNGLSYLVERLKHEGIVGHVTLAKSERSDLARVIAETL